MLSNNTRRIFGCFGHDLDAKGRDGGTDPGELAGSQKKATAFSAFSAFSGKLKCDWLFFAKDHV